MWKVAGIVNMLFYEVAQVYYSPNEVKAALVNGKASKEEVANKIIEIYPEVNFKNNDESDSFAIVVTHLIKTGGVING